MDFKKEAKGKLIPALRLAYDYETTLDIVSGILEQRQEAVQHETVVMQTSRPTIQDGKVYDFAEAFEEVKGVFGKRHKALGFYHISASRNKVMVHRCEIWENKQADIFALAIKKAYQKHQELK